MLARSLCEEILARALGSGGDYAEIFLEDTLRNTLVYSSGALETANAGEDYGASIRVLRGTECVYTYANDTSRKALLELATRAAAAIGNISEDRNVTLVERTHLNRTPIKIIPSSVENQAKLDIMRRGDTTARSYSSDIVQCVITFKDVDQKVFIATSDGVYTHDRRIHTFFRIKAVASDGSQNQTGLSHPDAQMGMELFKLETPEKCGYEAAKKAITMLHAQPCPAGIMPVVIPNRDGGVFFHESCGHSLESAAVSVNASLFAGQIGQRIASEKVTAIDDGTISNGWGSINVDDEGLPSTRNVLIENGILKGYMIDRVGARRMNAQPTGCGRKESYRFCPTSRMTNTYIAAGEDDDEEIIGSVDYGLYAASIGGGTANTQTGSFNFNVIEAYLIKNGKIAHPVRGATITGMAGEALQNIEMIGKNMQIGPGMCGSSSGSCPVGSGQPMIKLSKLVVGGK